MNTYDVGDVVEVMAAVTSRKMTPAEAREFYDNGVIPEGIGVEPKSVVCTVLDPSGKTSTPGVTGEGGLYKADVPATRHDLWRYAFDASEGFVAAGEGKFMVRKREVPR